MIHAILIFDAIFPMAMADDQRLFLGTPKDHAELDGRAEGHGQGLDDHGIHLVNHTYVIHVVSKGM